MDNTARGPKIKRRCAIPGIVQWTAFGPSGPLIPNVLFLAQVVSKPGQDSASSIQGMTEAIAVQEMIHLLSYVTMGIVLLTVCSKTGARGALVRSRAEEEYKIACASVISHLTFPMVWPVWESHTKTRHVEIQIAQSMEY
ncbi:uncharacterized protein LOC127845247 [Dreissena polymorpha]|uniref:Uncharacterized protein n=1 Tax=Dreissena polymorpha TaxID=45954 RepID=A0A9D4E2I3_DREPO|nr:uncharacterized protein LOC127845247 [Dreissena polymorpha]KAH3771628.1 hypothetical protein DPMN_172954 [Dreissena polymorpha]